MHVLDAGSVEQYKHGDGWSQICDSGWDDNDACVVCRELGFKDGKALCCNQVSLHYERGMCRGVNDRTSPPTVRRGVLWR